jgi:hypothetical protein
MTERHLDNEIDLAVRDIMSVDADAAFRARVLERLDRSKPRRFSVRTLAIAATAAVLLLAAVMMTRTPDVPVTKTAAGGASPVAAPAPVPGAGPVRDTTGDAATGPRAVASGSDTRRRSRQGQAASQIARGVVRATDAPLEQTVEIAPLAIDPITVAPLNTSQIVAQEIVVAPLEPIAEVQIAPLSPRSERD